MIAVSRNMNYSKKIVFHMTVQVRENLYGFYLVHWHKAFRTHGLDYAACNWKCNL